MSRIRQLPRSSLPRRGIASVLAMMYLVLFSVLAVGYYAQVTTSVAIADNDTTAVRSLRASESGMQFMKYQLAHLNISHTSADPFHDTYTALYNNLHGTLNMAGQDVGLSADGNTIYVPSDQTKYINIDKADGTGLQFNAYISKVNSTKLRVVISGRFNQAINVRDVRQDYSIAQNASQIFNYGVASKSPITMQGNVSITGTPGNLGNGSVLSATTQTNTPLTMTGSALISGDASFTNPNATPSISSSSTIAGFTPASSSYAQHVHFGVSPPEFPTIDTTVFKQYATNTYVNTMGSNLTNVTLPAGTYNFTNANIQGVVYVMQPSIIHFSGSTTVTGTIVVDNTVSGTYATSKTATTGNLIDFGGNVFSSPISSLPSTFPAGELGLTGAFILAPNFYVSFGGNFHTVNGTIIASDMSFYGNAGGTVNGTVVNLADSALSLAGNSDIIIASQGTTNHPPGVFFGNHFASLPNTYEELHP